MERKDVYLLVEQILQRPLNRFDYDKCEYYFTKYELPYVEVCLKNLVERVQSGQTRIFSTNYIDSYMFNNYEFYQAMKKAIPTQLVVEQVKEEQKVEEDDNMCKEEGWEGVTLEEREYLVAYLKHSFEPNEYEEPENPKNFDWREICNRKK